MALPFLPKNIDVNIDSRTWNQKPLPPEFKNVSSGQKIDVGAALHMLGTLTMPGLLSPASPALFWAWVRYYLAPADTDELRITMDFSDLDPHQKGILSDDFGVAIATKWLDDRFGGFVDIVDGRRFVLQFPNLLREPLRTEAKVGPNKCPDFVMRDKRGKWHVLECKGTQVRSYQSTSLRAAVQQKHALRLVGSVKGQQLASALFIANEDSDHSSHLKIIDPEDTDPVLTLSSRQSVAMEANARRLSIARALGAIGWSELATELTLPVAIQSDSSFLRSAESRRLSQPREDRYRQALAQMGERPLMEFADRGMSYRGREIRLELPPTNARLPFKFVHIRQGVSEYIVEQTLELASNPEGFDEQQIASSSEVGIITESTSNSTIIRHNDIMISEMVWEK